MAGVHTYLKRNVCFPSYTYLHLSLGKKREIPVSPTKHFKSQKRMARCSYLRACLFLTGILLMNHNAKTLYFYFSSISLFWLITTYFLVTSPKLYSLHPHEHWVYHRPQQGRLLLSVCARPLSICFIIFFFLFF